VRTNEGNVFYMNKDTKKSEWTVPEEIQVSPTCLDGHEITFAGRDVELELTGRLASNCVSTDRG
jgi:hypothetical protein